MAFLWPYVEALPAVPSVLIVGRGHRRQGCMASGFRGGVGVVCGACWCLQHHRRRHHGAEATARATPQRCAAARGD